MAERFIDSFEVYDTSQIYNKWTGYIENNGDGVILSSASGAAPGARTGTGYLQTENDGIFKTIDNQPTWYVGGAFYWSAVGNGGGVIIRNVGQICIQWAMQSDGRIQVLPGAGGSNGTMTSTIVINDGSWNYVELGVTLGTGGSAALKINGDTACSSSGWNITTFTSGDVINVIGGAGGQPMWTDDFYAFDGQGTDSYGFASTCTTFAGDSRIGTLTASADTPTVQWSVSAGSTHYNLVDEQPPDGDTTYVQSTMTGISTGPTDLYKFTQLPGTAATIICAQSNMFARKTDAASRAIVVVTTNAQGSSTGDQKYLNLDYVDYLNQFDVNPNNGALWTPAAINTTSWGAQVVI